MAYQKKESHHNATPSTTRPDPRYPFPTELNEKGQIVYLVPVEAPQDRTADSSVCNESKCSSLYFKEGKPMRVRFFATTDRQFAYDQRKWLNTLHTRERRMTLREVLLDGSKKDEDGESVPRDEHPLLADTEDGYIRAEYSDLPGRISEYIGKKYPKKPLYREVYKLLTEGISPKTISEKLGTKLEMVYYYREIVYRLALEYKQIFIDND